MKNIKEKINKIISLVLVILIIFTSLPWDVIAYDDGLLNNNIEKVENSDILNIKEESLLDAENENVNSNMIDIENDSVDLNLADKEVANDNSNLLDKENVTENDNLNTNIIDDELSNETIENSNTNNQDTNLEDKNIIDSENISASNENNNISEMPSDNIDEILKLNVAQSSNTADIPNEMAGTGDGFKVQLRWGGTTAPKYTWNSEKSEKRVIKLTFYYQNEVAKKSYKKDEIKVTIPGIGKLNRSSIIKATDIAADVYGATELKRDWSYQYNSQTDTYTFFNNKEIEAGSTFNGSFEMLWQFSSRECVNGYVQNLKATLIDGDKTVETQELTLNYTSKRDEFNITKTAKSITSADGLSKYVEEGKTVSDYAWVQYTFKYGLKNEYSRALKTRYFIDTLPEGCVIAKDTNVIKNEDKTVSYRIDESSVLEGSTREYSIIVGYPESYMERTMDNTVYLYGTYKDETENVLLDKNTVSVQLEKIQDQLVGIVPGKNMTPDSVYKEALNGDINFSASLTATSTVSSENNEEYTITITDDLLEIYNETDDEEKYTRLDDDEYKFTSVTVPGKNNFVNANGYTIADGNYTVTIKALYKDNVSTRGLDKYEEVYKGAWGKDSITQTLEKEAVAIRVEVSGLLESIKSFNVTVKGVINVSENVKNSVYSNPKQIINYDFAELLDKDGKSLSYEIDYSDKRIEEIDSKIYGRKVSRNKDVIQIKEYTPAPGTYSAHADIEPFRVDENVEYFTTTLNYSVSVNNKDKKEIKEVEIYGVTGKDELETLIEKLKLTYSGLSFKNALSSDVDMIDYLEEKATINKNGKEISIKFDFSDNPIVSTNFSLGYKVDARLNYEEYYNSTDPTYNITTYAYLDNGGLNAQSTGTYNSKIMSTAVDSESILLALASHQQLIKMVKTKYSGEFVQEDAVSPVDSEYTYRLKLRNGYNTLEKTEFVDILEHAELTVVDGENPYKESEWYGKFKNVDTSYIESKNLVPQVYYANSTNPSESDWNLMTKNENGIWTAENQDVKAVKVKIESGIAENSIVYVDINMTSPKNTEVDKKTYNTYTISCEAVDLYTGLKSTYMKNLPSNVVEVRLVEKEYNLVITKTDATSGKKLAGAVFAIYDEDKEIKLGNITGILGDTVIKGLKEGTYTIKEKVTPLGYETIDDYTLTIKDGKYTLKCGEKVLQSEVLIDLQETIPTISIIIENHKKTGSIKIHKIDEYLTSEKEEVPLEGIQFDLLTTDGKVIYTDTTDENGYITFQNLEWGNTYIVKEKEKQNGYKLALENVYLSRLVIDKEVDIKNIRETGSVTLVKQDELDESIKLAGAKYKLYAEKDIYDKDGNILYNQGDYIQEAITNEQGEVTFDELIWGDYYLQESETVYGYDLSEEKYSFTISAENVENSIQFTEKEKRSKAKLQLIKVDEDGSFLPGAEFGLFKGNGDEDGDQIINRNVETGEEELTFTSPEATVDTYGWKQNDDGTWQSENYKKSNSTATMVSNEFTLKYDGKISFDWSVSSQGVSNDYVYYTIISEDIEKSIGGEETKIGGTTRGYGYDSLTYDRVVLQLEKGTYKIKFIYKKDDSSDSSLDSAYVKNAKVSYEQIEEFPNITDSNGLLNIEGLEWGEYYIQEIKPPQGYVIDNAKYRFSVNRETFKDGHKAVTTVSNVMTGEQISKIKNTRKRGKATLIKYRYDEEGNETTEALEGAVYELYSADGKIVNTQTENGEAVTEHTTNEEGKITVDNLDWGSYYFQEKQAPEGYSISDKKIAFVVNGKNVDFEQQLVAYDKQESGEIKINKTISAESIYNGHGNATFIFKIVGKDKNGIEKIVQYRTVTFTELDLENIDEHGNITKTITMQDIQAYTYEITEEANYRYELDVITPGKNASVDGNKGIIDLSQVTEKKEGEITFSNNKNNNSLLSDNGLITNSVQSQYYLIGISAEPKKDNYEVGNELTAEDFIYTLYYSGGQEEVKELREGITFNGKSTYSEEQIGSYITKIEYTLAGRKYETETITNWIMPNDYFTYKMVSNKENTIVITGINEKYISPEILYIPGEYNGYRVKRIGYNSVNSGDSNNGKFKNIDNVISIEISEGIEEIGAYTFFNYSKIQKVNFPYTITYIGKQAFYNCSKLESIDLSETQITTIGDGAFSSCSNLESIDLSETPLTTIGSSFSSCRKLESIDLSKTQLTTIGSNAFYNCSGLSNIDLPNSVTSIGNTAFRDCSKLERIDLSKTQVTTIGSSAFESCNKLKSVGEIPNSLESIGSRAFRRSGLQEIDLSNCKVTKLEGSMYDYGNLYGVFSECKSLEKVKLPKNLTIIGNSTFGSCSNLTSVYIYNNVIRIDANAFYGCSSLTSIEIPNSVTTIGDYAFRGCSELLGIELPDSVTSIGNSVFNGCSNLSNINVVEESKYYISVDGILYDKEMTTLILYPGGKIDKTEFSIPSSVTTIVDSAFYGCSSLTSIKVPNSVTSIGAYAFYKCSVLDSMDLSETHITSISNNSFESCSKLSIVKLPDGVISIGSDAFESCSKLLSIEIPNSVTSIGTDAFFNCSSLESIDLSKTKITSIATRAFEWCRKLKSIELPSSVISIGNSAFDGCTNLESIDLSKTKITSIGSSTFSGCSNLVSIDLSKTKITSIETSTFYSCKNLASIEIPNSVTSIGNFAFNSCNNLTTIKFYGTKEAFEAITVGSDNTPFTSAQVEYISE